MTTRARVAVEEWGLRRLESLVARFERQPRGPEHLRIGVRGEMEAFFYLRRAGVTVVARRWTSGKVRGDLDLVVWDGGTLCFVEVKTRTARDSMAAEVAVDRGKREQMRRLARAYLRGFAEEARERVEARFDVVSVYLLATGVECERMENAFGWVE